MQEERGSGRKKVREAQSLPALPSDRLWGNANRQVKTQYIQKVIARGNKKAFCAVNP